jgi:hypothetical protein
MRWRIPLVAVLALFVAVSCDQQLVEPPTDASDQALFDSKANPAQIYEYTFTWSDYDACGIDVVSGDLLCKVNDYFSVGKDQCMESERDLVV